MCNDVPLISYRIANRMRPLVLALVLVRMLSLSMGEGLTYGHGEVIIEGRGDKRA